MVDALRTIANFYHHESCGQCTPCREGCGWIEKLLIDLEAGRGEAADLDKLIDIADNMEGNTICVLADSLAMPVRSFVRKFKEEFVEHVRRRRCPYRFERGYAGAAPRDAPPFPPTEAGAAS